MTVSELIEALRALPADAPVFTLGQEDYYFEIKSAVIEDVPLDDFDQRNYDKILLGRQCVKLN